MKHVQLRWFKSEEFLNNSNLKKDKDLKGYLNCLRKEGYQVAFMEWNESGEFEWDFTS